MSFYFKNLSVTFSFKKIKEKRGEEMNSKDYSL